MIRNKKIKCDSKYHLFSTHFMRAANKYPVLQKTTSKGQTSTRFCKRQPAKGKQVPGFAKDNQQRANKYPVLQKTTSKG